MRRLTLTLLFTLSIVPLLAQPPTVQSIRIDLARSNAPDVISHQQTYPLAAFQCNRAPSPASPPVLINPTKFEWDDPANAGRVCQVDASTFLNSLPPGDYIGKAFFQYTDTGIGGPAVVAPPFTRFTYAAPTGPRFVR